MLLLVGGWMRQHNKRNAGVLKSYRGSCLAASKEWGPESFNHRELSSLLLLFWFFWLHSVARRAFLTRDWICGPCSGSMDHQGSSLMCPYVIPDICNLWIPSFFSLDQSKNFNFIHLFKYPFSFPDFLYCFSVSITLVSVPPNFLLLTEDLSHSYFYGILTWKLGSFESLF